MSRAGPIHERTALALGAVAVLLSRLPWIGADYGSDPDSYRVVGSARILQRSGEYQASRLPGYPAYEYLVALTAAGPAWLSNLVTALFSVAAFVLFSLILSKLQVRRSVLLGLGFAFVPVIYLNSCNTMDYIPALTAMLAAAYAVLSGRPVIGGVMLGLAVGFRLTAGALGLPLCVWMLQVQPWRAAFRPIFLFGITTLAVSALCFVPVYRVYGLDFFAFYDNDSFLPMDVVFERALPLVWGWPGTLALIASLCSLPFIRRHIRLALQRESTLPALALCLISSLLYLIAFLRLPDESGYLVPLVPWVLIALSLLLPSALTSVLAWLLMLSAWTGDGSIIEDHRVRESQHSQTQAIISATRALPGSAVIVSGWVFPRITLALDGDRLGSHQFIYLVEGPEDYQQYLDEGHQIYYLPGVEVYEAQAHQLELAELGARRLNIPRERQRPASTGE